MNDITPLEYLYIDIANCYGMDKELWEDRIQWTKDNEGCLEAIVDKTENPILYLKAVNTLRNTQEGKWTGHMMSLDSTSSGVQLMSALTGDAIGGANSNIVNTGERRDFYTIVTKGINDKTGSKFRREEVKPAGMTVFYGSKREPELVFGEDTPELDAFYEVLEGNAPGAMELMGDMRSCIDKWTDEYNWIMPDQHHVKCKILIPNDKRIEIDELNHSKITYRTYMQGADPKSVSLLAHIVHSVDGYVVREMVRRLHKEHIEMLPIHDSFWAHPCDMHKVRYHYKEILADIADSNMMQDIFRAITGSPLLTYTKSSYIMGNDIRKSEYALS